MISGIYLVPGILTAANMGLGFYSITASIKGNWQEAAWCTLISIIVDIFDGRIARWTNSTSKFGVEFDSFADWISFGIAPALLMYLLVLKDHVFLRNHERVAVAIAFLFIVCSAIRLARFNLKALSEEEPTPYFTGLPTPAAGGILASFVILFDILAEGKKKIRMIKIVMQQIPTFYQLLPAIICVLALLMVSGLRYSSFKKVNFLKPRSLRAFLMMIVVCLMIYIYPQNTIFVLFVGYVCSGIFEFFWRGYKMRGSNKFQIETPEGGSWEVKRKGGSI